MRKIYSLQDIKSLKTSYKWLWIKIGYSSGIYNDNKKP